ncbi:MAG: hypothetical protein J6S14_22005 [Clostridia bacterium]|nr:hypothetical protein [Clostridia bacterium]
MTVNADNIPVNGSVVAEYQTPSVTKVVLKAANGNVLSGGTDGAAYTVYGNPLFSTITADDVTGAATIPVFTPAVEETIYADPSVEPGDSVDGENSFPLMRQTIHWAKYTESTYEATGTANRPEDPLLQNAYNARVSGASAVNAMNQRDVFNKLTNNGEMQGMFLDGDGNIYINGTYIQAHTIGADRLDVSDLYAIGATIGGFTIDSDSIRSGAKTDTASGSITLSTSDFTRLINAVSRSGLRFAIGANFGIDNMGHVYMSGADVSGTIEALASSLVDPSQLRAVYTLNGVTYYAAMTPTGMEISDGTNTFLIRMVGGITSIGPISISSGKVYSLPTANGNLAYTGETVHENAIVTVPVSASPTEICRTSGVAGLAAGRWLVTGWAIFPPDAGTRQIFLATDTGTFPANESGEAICAGSSDSATLNFVTTLELQTAGVYRLMALHTGNSALTVSGELRAVRIA